MFFFSSRRRHTRFKCDWSSDVCSSDLNRPKSAVRRFGHRRVRYLATDGQPHWFFYFDDSKVVVDADTKVAQGVCPKDNRPHVPDKSSLYGADFSGPGVPGQAGWKWCRRCDGMFYAGNGLVATHCPPTSSQHNPTGSGDYT